MKMSVCRNLTEHDTVTEAVLCDAGNVALACVEHLLAMIQFPEITDTSVDRQRKAYNNLRSRFGYTEEQLRSAKEVTS